MKLSILFNGVSYRGRLNELKKMIKHLTFVLTDRKIEMLKRVYGHIIEDYSYVWMHHLLTFHIRVIAKHINNFNVEICQWEDGASGRMPYCVLYVVDTTLGIEMFLHSEDVDDYLGKTVCATPVVDRFYETMLKDIQKPHYFVLKECCNETC